MAIVRNRLVNDGAKTTTSKSTPVSKTKATTTTPVKTTTTPVKTTTTPAKTTSSSSSSSKSSSNIFSNLLSSLSSAAKVAQQKQNGTYQPASTAKTTTPVTTAKTNTGSALANAAQVAAQKMNGTYQPATQTAVKTAGNTSGQTVGQTLASVKNLDKTPDPSIIPTYDLAAAKDQAYKYATDNNLPAAVRNELLKRAGNTTLDQAVAARKALDDAGIEGRVLTNPTNPYSSSPIIETKDDDGNTILTNYVTGEQGGLPSRETIDRALADLDLNQDQDDGGGSYYYGGGSRGGGSGGGGDYTPYYEGSENYYDDLMQAFMEQNAAARDAAIEAILANLEAVKGTYKGQIDDAIEEYQKLVDQNEVAKDRARRSIRENQANRGQLDSGLGRQEQLNMNIGYDTIRSNLQSARQKAVNDIMNLIAQAEYEANNNKANVINNYNNAALEYALAMRS